MPQNNYTVLRENSFYISLLLFVISLPFSEAFVSIAATLLCLQAIIFFVIRRKENKPAKGNTGLMMASIFGLYVLGMLFTKDFGFALYELKKIIFWLIVPLAFVLSPPLPSNKFRNVLTVFCVLVLAVSFYAIIRLVFKETLQITDFRDITPISHIRFSYQVVLSIWVGLYFIYFQNEKRKRKNFRIIWVVYVLWMIVFLVILKSITGIVAFIGATGFLLMFYVYTGKSKLKYVGLILLIVLFCLPVIYTKKIWDDFYNIERLDKNTVELYTANGNPYSFNFESNEKENGNWVNVYICDKELREEWNKLSEMKYDSVNAHGFSNRSTLVRYLTSKGLRKDSIGVSQLNIDDINAIEAGIANFIFNERRFSVYPRIYETIWEYDRYKESGNPNGQSLSQRIEFGKASFLIIKDNFWFGIGTGNWKIYYAEAYDILQSKLKKENQRSSHNQYLNYMVKFGILGFIYIITILLIPVFKSDHSKNLLLWLFLVSMAIANLGDANFESHMGLSFFSFFYCLFVWYSPQNLKHFTFANKQDI